LRPWAVQPYTARLTFTGENRTIATRRQPAIKLASMQTTSHIGANMRSCFPPEGVAVFLFFFFTRSLAKSGEAPLPPTAEGRRKKKNKKINIRSLCEVADWKIYAAKNAPEKTTFVGSFFAAKRTT